MANKGTIPSPRLQFKPSQKLSSFVKNHLTGALNVPKGIRDLLSSKESSIVNEEIGNFSTFLVNSTDLETRNISLNSTSGLRREIVMYPEDFSADSSDTLNQPEHDTFDFRKSVLLKPANIRPIHKEKVNVLPKSNDSLRNRIDTSLGKNNDDSNCCDNLIHSEDAIVDTFSTSVLLKSGEIEAVKELNILPENNVVLREKMNVSLNDNQVVKNEPSIETEEDCLLNLEDLKWIHKYIRDQNLKGIYFHELFEGSEIILPKNQVVPRSQALEERCKKLRNSLNTKEYHKMTKKVDCTMRCRPDTVAAELKEIDKELVVVFQLIISVLAGFMFGFIGLELMIGELRLQKKLLMGIFCALAVGSAELYFLLKKVSAEESYAKKVEASPKID